MAEPQDPATYTGLVLVLMPQDGDPTIEASSEPAHLTTVFMGEASDYTEDQLSLMSGEVRSYAAALDGPVVVPVRERGELGDDGADVVFLESTDALRNLRDGLLESSPTIKEAMDSVKQFPEWTPHVTLGYPETPARGEYDAEEVTFDRLGLWVAGEQQEYPMGGTVSDENERDDEAILASARAKVAAFDMAGVIADVEDEDDEMPADELEDGEEEVTEIPVHGVAVIEGKATGDGRGFKLNALDLGKMPQPLGYEYTSTHGGDTSNVSVVGRIDEYERKDLGDGQAELRWRGVIMPGKEYGARAIESIVDGSYTGLSVIVDSITVDVEDEREEFRRRFMAERDADVEADAEEGKPRPRTDEEIEEMVDAFIGDGTTPVTWFSTARVRRFDMVPTGAFQEAYIALGWEFADELDEEALVAAANALEDCGCGTVRTLTASGSTKLVDLTSLTEEQLSQYDEMSEEEQDLYAQEMGLYVSFAPGTKDGPGWITHPTATARIRRYWVKGKGAAKIAWGTPGDFNRCRSHLAKYVQNPEWLAGLCANMHKEAIGVWPGQEGGGRHSLAASAEQRAAAPLVVLASASDRTVYPASAFEAPDEGRAFALRIDREARTIKGYAAAWGSCHIGIDGMCQQAPPSHTDYAHFRKGVVDTDQGEQRVGLITAGIGHAGGRLSAAAATAHYDQTDAVRAYINIGEDMYGIWYAGVLSPFATDDDIDELRAIGRVSGDWRSSTGRPEDLEMVGLVAVNTEGFQLVASGGVQTAAIGIGALPKEEAAALAASASVDSDENVEYVAQIVERAIGRIEERNAQLAASAEARERLNNLALADARRRLSERI